MADGVRKNGYKHWNTGKYAGHAVNALSAVAETVFKRDAPTYQ